MFSFHPYLTLWVDCFPHCGRHMHFPALDGQEIAMLGLLELRLKQCSSRFSYFSIFLIFPCRLHILNSKVLPVGEMLLIN